jgi:surface antigen
MVLGNPRADTVDSAQALDSSTVAAPANPLDQVSSTDIALTVARASSLPETTAISNQAQSQAAEVAIASNDKNVMTKPEVITTTLKSRADIQSYIFKKGDTIPDLATRFDITSNSIRWSNNVTGDTVPVGTRLWIPPVNGIVYVVKSGDTPQSLAVRFNSSKQQILAYNDGEISGIHVGERIIIPNASQVSSPGGNTVSSRGVSFPWGSSPIYGYNGYDFGNCTWYVASQINVPSNWGNANTWAYYARLSGWNVSSRPSVGSIAQTSAGYFGHVAIVKAVHSNGSVTITEMNFNGFDVVDTRTVSPHEFQNYITR